MSTFVGMNFFWLLYGIDEALYEGDSRATGYADGDRAAVYEDMGITVELWYQDTIQFRGRGWQINCANEISPNLTVVSERLDLPYEECVSDLAALRLSMLPPR